MQSQFLSTMSNDDLRNIMLYANIDTLENICYTRRGIEACNDKHFWITKFQFDDLPIVKIGTTLEEWLEEYRKIELLRVQAIQMIENGEKIFIESKDFQGFKNLPFYIKSIMGLYHSDAKIAKFIFLLWGVNRNGYYLNINYSIRYTTKGVVLQNKDAITVLIYMLYYDIISLSTLNHKYQ